MQSVNFFYQKERNNLIKIKVKIFNKAKSNKIIYVCKKERKFKEIKLIYMLI